LRYHGRHFPQFLRNYLAEDEAVAHGFRPDMPDLASLEWARIDAFDAPSAPPLRRDELIALEPRAWSRLRLRSAPCVRLIETPFNVSALWSAVERGSAPPEPSLGPERLVIWRRGFHVYHRRVSESEAAALDRLRTGVQFPTLCECFADARVSEHDCAVRAFSVLEQWLADEIVTVEE